MLKSSLADRLKSSISVTAKVLWTRRPEILLCPQIPKPMHQLAPRVILGQRWWDETRQAAYVSANHHCIACGDYYPSHLEAHEVYSIDYLAGRMTYIETVPLCHLCHCYIHIGRLQALLNKGEVSQDKFTHVLLHGDQVLLNAKLKRAELYEGPFADWNKWRLVLNGKEYKPVFKTYKAWCKHFGVKDA